MQCYSVAARLAEDGTFVNLAARAGRLLLKMGMEEMDEEAERSEIHGVIEACNQTGGTLKAMGHVLEACVSTEIMKSKYVPLSVYTIFVH